MRDTLQNTASPPRATPGPPDRKTGTESALPGSSGIGHRLCSRLYNHLATTIGARGTSLTGAVGERMFVISGALYTSVVIMLMNAETALAQGSGGGGGAVEGALQSAVDWLSNIIVVVGTLGLLVASVFWIFSGSNERRREKATGWVASCGIAIAVAFLAPSLVTLIQSWTGGGGGGG